ncbi:MAG: serine hydrolase [Mobilitalea sp.]
MARNIKKYSKIILVSIIVVLLAIIIISSVMLSPTFVYRILSRWDSSVKDYNFFSSNLISKSEVPYEYEYDLDTSLENLIITYRTTGNREVSTTLTDFVVSTDSTSFIIVKNDTVIYEQYANGSNRDSINTSFSMAKSMVSLLIGKAIEDGYIDSEYQLISDFIHEFKGTDMEHITIKDLLTMRSDIHYEETGFLWFRDDAYTYWMPDLRELALNHRQLTGKYQGRFHYNNYHPLLLGIILERSTGRSVSEYFEQSFWQEIGSEYDASWSLDSDKTQFEKMESGLNFRSIDYIKLGSMLLNDGYWNNQQIINQNWIQRSVFVDFPINEDEYEGSILEGMNIGYGYMWYSRPSTYAGMDFWSWGKYNQIMYMSPENDIVILRTGSTSGDVQDFSKVLADITVNIMK